MSHSCLWRPTRGTVGTLQHSDFRFRCNIHFLLPFRALWRLSVLSHTFRSRQKLVLFTSYCKCPLDMMWTLHSTIFGTRLALQPIHPWRKGPWYPLTGSGYSGGDYNQGESSPVSANFIVVLSVFCVFTYLKKVS